MGEIFNMGGYELYVWTSVGIVCTALLILSWHARANFKRAQKQAAWSQHAQR
jgi:heme exporter protein CcmD